MTDEDNIKTGVVLPFEKKAKKTISTSTADELFDLDGKTVSFNTPEEKKEFIKDFWEKLHAAHFNNE